MTIFVSYGANWLVVNVPFWRTDQHRVDKLFVFEKLIESKIGFKVFFEWFRNQEDFENTEVRGRMNFAFQEFF